MGETEETPSSTSLEATGHRVGATDGVCRARRTCLVALTSHPRLIPPGDQLSLPCHALGLLFASGFHVSANYKDSNCILTAVATESLNNYFYFT